MAIDLNNLQSQVAARGLTWRPGPTSNSNHTAQQASNRTGYVPGPNDPADGHVEIVISNNADGWTGVLRWNGGALAPVWMSASPINGPAGSWFRGADSFTAADIDGDGHVEIVIANNSNGWTGLLRWV